MGSSIVSGLGLAGDYLLDGTITAGDATLTTLVDFDNNDGDASQAVLIADAAGDLFGTTNSGGANNAGEVFELANTGTGYASTPALLTSFSNATGYNPACRPGRRRRRRSVRHDGKRRGGRRRHGIRDRQHRHRLRQHADHSGCLQWHERWWPERRSGCQCRRRSLRHDGGGRDHQLRHGVRDCLCQRQLCQRADHAGQFQQRERSVSLRRPGHRRRGGPVRHHGRWRDRQRRHGVRDCLQQRHLCQHRDHARHLQQRRRARSVCRPDRGHRRGPVRHDAGRWRERRRHGVRDREDQRHVRQHAGHPGHFRWLGRSVSQERSDLRRRGGFVRHDAGRRRKQPWHGVRNCQRRRQLCHHPAHRLQFQRHRRLGAERPDCQCRRGSVRHRGG